MLVPVRGAGRGVGRAPPQPSVWTLQLELQPRVVVQVVEQVVLHRCEHVLEA